LRCLVHPGKTLTINEKDLEMKFNFHHVHLLCSDLEATIGFFRDVLGASVVRYAKFGGADGATLNLHGTTINLRVKTEAEKPAGDSSLVTYGYHHICVQTEDVDAAHADFSARGIEFISGPTTTPDSRIAFLRGPDNIVVELMQPLQAH
jgi:catechol 2,3-dioxygenase-like lactoylglutathione lyase family enzyme